MESLSQELPVCTAGHNEKPGITCTPAVAAGLAQELPTAGIAFRLPVCDGSNGTLGDDCKALSQELPSCNGNNGTAGVHCTAAAAGIAFRLPVCDGSNGTLGNDCRALSQELPICNGTNGSPNADCRNAMLAQVHDWKSGDIVRICNGANAEHGCLNPLEMKNP